MWRMHCFILFLSFVAVHGQFFIDWDECWLSSKNQSIIIDLSRSDVSDYSFENYAIHISFCPQSSSDRKCPENSLICVEDQSKAVLDIGSNITKIFLEGPDLYALHIESTHGSGEFLISCSENPGIQPSVNSFSKDENDDFYRYSIIWMSSSVCRRKQYTAINNCILYTKELSFDLRPLQYLPDNVVTHGAKIFYVSICRNVSNIHCPSSTVCVFKGHAFNGATAIAETGNSVLQYVDGRGLKLSYNNYRGNKTTVINFQCSENTHDPVIKYVREDNGVYFFNMTTSVVCPPLKMECWVGNPERGGAFDLSELHRISRNWEIKLKNGKKIFFNVCGSLNYVPHIFCTGEKYFACLVDEQNKTLAYADVSKSEVESRGGITLSYLGETTKQTNFSIKIIMKCSDKDSNPFIQEDTNISFTLLWKSRSACPSFMDKGSSCQAKNLYTDQSVDISGLHKNNLDYLVKGRNKTFRINICGNLNKSCSKNKESSVCYKMADGSEISIGETGSSELIFKDGLYVLKLEGEPCHQNILRSRVTINLFCSSFENNSSSTSIPQFHSVNNECEFIFEWRTNLVCKDLQSSNCSLQINNKTSFDLSSLRNPNKNYFVPLNTTVGIVLNVCLSVLLDRQMRCPAQSGACLINRNLDYITANDYVAKKMFENLGLVSKTGNLEYRNGSLYLSYFSGGICETGDHGSHFTSVEFVCNKTAFNTSPVFIEYRQCEYKFLWVTHASCPKIIEEPNITTELPKKTTKPPIPKVNPSSFTPIPMKQTCDVMDPRTHERFNLSLLKGHSWLVENSNITIAVCTSLHNSLCPKSSGACTYSHESGYTSIGDYNLDLKYEEGSLYLLYKTSNDRFTKIEFVCNMVTLQPKFIAERKTREGLITFISWPTQLACIKEVETSCCKKIKPLCDYYNGTYEVAISSKQSAFLSLCRPISPKTGLLCTNSTPACIGAHRAESSFSDEKILGKVIQQSVISDGKSIVLKYLGGSVCEQDSRETYSTYIRFFCNESASQPRPVFVNVKNNCQYTFDWGSTLLCNGTYNKNCDIFGDGVVYPSESLRLNRLVGKKGDYMIELCDQSKKCSGDICKSVKNGTWETFGLKQNISVLSSSRVINYSNPHPYGSQNDKCGTIVEITCNKNRDTIQDPVLKKETDCFIYITLEHKLGCSAASHTSENNVKGDSSLVWLIFISLLILLLVVAMLWFFWLKLRKQGISPSINRILRYKKVNGDSLSSLVPADDSADECTIIFNLEDKIK